MVKAILTFVTFALFLAGTLTTVVFAVNNENNNTELTEELSTASLLSSPDIGDIPAKSPGLVQQRGVHLRGLKLDEIKLKKKMQKFGFWPIPGILRVVSKTSFKGIFVTSKPDVFEKASADEFAVFGEIKNDTRFLKSDDLFEKYALSCDDSPEIEEVNMFKEDGKVIHFVNPKVSCFFSEADFYFVEGPSETNDL